MSDPRFLHLRVHSAYSLLEGALPMKKLPGLVADAGFPAVAVTDTNNLFGALEFAEGAAKAGLQPIIGTELSVIDADPEPGARQPDAAKLVLLAQDRAGYENLMALSSAAFMEVDASALPHVTLDAVERYAEGVICLTGGADGPLGRLIAAGKDASPLARRLMAAFPDRLYVEIQRHGTGGALRTEA
ncbi:MAG: PHP domain-containing protein, partial [Pseudomonadota bacterium]